MGFARELAKYKVVRRADHHKIREKAKRGLLTAGKSAPAPSAPARIAPKQVKTDQKGEFWSLIHTASSSILTPSETDQFIQKLRKEQETVSRQVNLDDLNSMVK